MNVLLETLQGIRSKRNLRIFGYVVMPEHVHLVLHPSDEIKLGPLIGEIKSKSASRIISRDFVTFPNDCLVSKGGEQRWAFWQPRCYDHNCRTSEAVVEKINYCHNNPVKRGLVSEAAQWRWSSCNWYNGVTDVPLAMDELGI